MSKRLKIIIAIALTLILALGMYIAPRIIPYTPPNPNIVKTDQGSFELRMSGNIPISYIYYKEHEGYAKDYYNRISKIVKDPNLVVNSYVNIRSDGYFPDSNIMTTTSNKYGFKPGVDLSAIYINYFRNNIFEFDGFDTYPTAGNSQSITLEQLLQTPEYQNLKINN